jgi:hypothetical protein
MLLSFTSPLDTRFSPSPLGFLSIQYLTITSPEWMFNLSILLNFPQRFQLGVLESILGSAITPQGFQGNPFTTIEKPTLVFMIPELLVF